MNAIKNPAPLARGHRAKEGDLLGSKLKNKGSTIPRSTQALFAAHFPIIAVHWPLNASQKLVGIEVANA